MNKILVIDDDEAINQLITAKVTGIIYDDTDYNKVDYAQGKYSIASLNRAYASNKRRNELILANYLKYRRRQALGFCCSREHAENMAGYFCQKDKRIKV